MIDLGRASYEAAYAEQVRHQAEVLAARDAGQPMPGRILLVEHDPVITVSRRAGAGSHLLADPRALADAGVRVVETDRGGDITYHGPGQLVVYPILDLNRLNLGLHAYMRLLESAAIDACESWGLPARRDPSATGVWVGEPGRKICAMGVRVRRWVSMHGLAINVSTNLDHFRLIVPCGLVGREVTSFERELGESAPTLDEVKAALIGALDHQIESAKADADRLRGEPGGGSGRTN